MALKPQAEKSAAFAQTDQTPSGDQGAGGLGNPMTLLLLLVAAGFLWWNMRRRRQFEDRLREQRRVDAAAQAEQSALNVANIMRSAPSRAEAAAAATEGLASAARMPSTGAGANLVEDAPVDLPERARGAAEADRVAAEQAERAAHEAELTELGRRGVVKPAEVVAAQARADTAEATGSAASTADLDAAAAAMEGAQVARDDAAVVAEASANEADALRRGVVAGATGAVDEAREATEALRAGLRELDNEAAVPFGAVAGNETADCPAGFPVKGNAQSMIYHEPGQTSYPPTIAEFCFASAAAAEASGYRRSRARAQRSPD